MHLQFPNDFLWGTSTAAAQIETASNHNFRGIKSRDGYVFDRTTDHEKRREEDVAHICRFGTIYRCGVDWARLQTEPLGDFHMEVVMEYRHFFQMLTERDMSIMFVLHHFTHPKWFEEKGGWLVEENISFFTDYVKKCIQHFGKYVSYWNTFNEPNTYAFNAFLGGNFPPHKRSWFAANNVLQHMGIAHKTVYTMLKVYDKHKPVGISQLTIQFKPLNILAYPFAKLADWWFHKHTANQFEDLDFIGLSYYAMIPMSPFPVSEVHSPGKLDKMGIKHDKMWAYCHEGLGKMLRRFWKKYKKPIFICENGICTDNCGMRIQAIKDYLKEIHGAIRDDVYVNGYIHWTTFDNFEWDLGPTYRFGLLRVDWDTKERIDTEAARFYEKVTKANAIDV